VRYVRCVGCDVTTKLSVSEKYIKYNNVTCRGIRVTNNCGSWISRLGLSDVTSTITLSYNNSHIQLFLDVEYLTVVCIFCISLL
jgi:hypothetical protein